MEFAPVNTTGNFRTLKFVKYISSFAIEPVIVTLKVEQASTFFNAPIDDSLLKEIPSDINIYRIPCKSNSDAPFGKLSDFINIFFSIKDSLGKRWWPFLKTAIGPIIEKHQPAAIYTSLPPFSTGGLAVKISKKFNLPLILDMRDLWLHWCIGPHKSWIHYFLTKKAEERIFKQAKAIVVVTPQMKSIITKSHASLSENKVHYIPNGFDMSLEKIIPFSFNSRTSEVIIGYVGSFYYDPKNRNNFYKKWWEKRPHEMIQFVTVKSDWLYRSPYFFFRTVSYIRKHYPEIGTKIRIEFIGKKPNWLDEMLIEFDLQSCFTSHGFVNQKRSIELQKNFDILLATSEKIENGEHFCLPSKIFDYVVSGKPVLGFVTKGIQKDFIEKSGIGIVCDPDDISTSVSSIVNLLTNGANFKPDINYLAKFERKQLSLELANLFKTVVCNLDRFNAQEV
ncbi:MAG TPA: hypothetical protein DCQ29_12710 [Chitinophagaceae bacterium]|nr:hypothetical protein [Chitinophagaceae bacterium]